MIQRRRFRHPFLLTVGVAVLLILLGCGAFVVLGPTEGTVFMDFAAPQIGITVDETLHITDIARNSPALHAGIRPGDFLVQVGNSRRFTSAAEALQLSRHEILSRTRQVRISNRQEIQEVQPLNVVINRYGTEMSFTLTPSSVFPATPGSGSSAPTVTAVPGNLVYL